MPTLTTLPSRKKQPLVQRYCNIFPSLNLLKIICYPQASVNSKKLYILISTHQSTFLYILLLCVLEIFSCMPIFICTMAWMREKEAMLKKQICFSQEMVKLQLKPLLRKTVEQCLLESMLHLIGVVPNQFPISCSSCASLFVPWSHVLDWMNDKLYCSSFLG